MRESRAGGEREGDQAVGDHEGLRVRAGWCNWFTPCGSQR
jgi:hypothetical protein